jgi:tetratricopeptide (TPR) repeat protein
VVEFVSFRALALLLTATVAVGSISLPPAALAAGSEESAATEAKKHYEEGTKAFNLGEFPRAIAEFKTTYNAKPDPLLLYNIAQSYRLAGDASQAVFFYKSFLRNMPAATNRKEVEMQIRKLEKQLQAQAPAAPSAAQSQLPLDDQKREPAPTPEPIGSAPPAVNPPAVTGPSEGDSAARAPAPPRRPSASPALAPLRVDSAHESLGARPAAGSPSHSVDLTTPAHPAEDAAPPIYKKWWFWAGAAGAVLIIGGIAAANAKKSPTTTLGTYDPTFM